MNFWGFPCKTPGCKAWLKMGELKEDTLRAVHFPINLGEDPIRLKCLDCGKTHDYAFNEKELVKDNAFSNSQAK
jgi:hypothetical protein